MGGAKRILRFPLFFRVGIFVSLSGPTSLPPSIISSLTVSPFSEDVGRYPHRHPVSLTPFPSPPFSIPSPAFKGAPPPLHLA